MSEKRYLTISTPGIGPNREKFLELYNERGLSSGHVYSDYGCGYDFCILATKEEESSLMEDHPDWYVLEVNEPDTRNSWGETYRSLIARAQLVRG